MAEELLAQVVEEVSILAAEKRRDKPRAVPRPWDEEAKKAGVSAGGGGMHGGLFDAAQDRMRTVDG